MEQNYFPRKGPIESALQNAKMYDSISSTTTKEDIANKQKSLKIFRIAMIVCAVMALSNIVMGFAQNTYFALSILWIFFASTSYLGRNKLSKQLVADKQAGMYLIGRIYDPHNDVTVKFKASKPMHFLVKKDNTVTTVQHDYDDPEIPHADVRQIDFVSIPLVEDVDEDNAFINLIVFVLSKKNRSGFYIEVVPAKSYEYIINLTARGNKGTLATGPLHHISFVMNQVKMFEVHYPENFDGESQLRPIEEIKRKLKDSHILSRTAHAEFVS